MTLFFISLAAGALTVLAPCILPLLPIIIGSGAGARSKWTPYIVIASLGVSILLFTYLLKASTLLIDIPPYVWSYISGGILVLFGITLLFPSLWEHIPGLSKLSQSSNKAIGSGHTKKSIWGDITIGAALGPVFSTCSPTYFVILATVLPESFLVGTFYLLAYILGLSVVLLAIAILGQRFTEKLNVAADPKGWFKRGLGVIFLLVGIAIISGFDKVIETAVLDSGFFDVTQIENRLLEEGGIEG